MSKAGRSGEAGPPYTVLEAALGTAVEPGLLERALTHRSYAYEHGGLPTNERLEFLGDSVLGLAVTDTLYRAHPDLAEGQLAKLRASVVNTRALAGVARELGLGRWLRLGRGEEVTGGRDKNSILADTTEAVIGAVYLDRGVEAAVALVRRLFGPLMQTAASQGAALDWKTALQELAAARSLGVPDYRVTESGPDHAKSFAAVVRVADAVQGEGIGRSKKEAEQEAAEAAVGALTAGGGAADDGEQDDETTRLAGSDPVPGDPVPGDPVPGDPVPDDPVLDDEAPDDAAAASAARPSTPTERADRAS